MKIEESGKIVCVLYFLYTYKLGLSVIVALRRDLKKNFSIPVLFESWMFLK
jgi:hypothetical protein